MGGADRLRAAAASKNLSWLDPNLSQSLVRGMLILHVLWPRGTELGLAEIAEETGLGRSTVHRYVVTLMELGLVEQRETSREYRLIADGPS